MNKHWVKIIHINDQIEIQMFLEILDKEGIKSIAKQSESGDFLNIYMGNSIYGADIYVEEKFASQAIILYEAFFSEKHSDSKG